MNESKANVWTPALPIRAMETLNAEPLARGLAGHFRSETLIP